MKKRITAAFLAVCAALCGCGGTPAKTLAATTTVTAKTEPEKPAYTFKKITAEEFNAATADMKYSGDPVYSGDEADDAHYCLFYGKVRRRFGEPDDTSDNWENMYNYYIEVSSDGEPLYLNVYHGSRGSGVAKPTGLGDEAKKRYKEAKRELLKYINSTDPADYTWEGVYPDTGACITYSITDGKPSVKYGIGAGLSDFLDMM